MNKDLAVSAWHSDAVGSGAAARRNAGLVMRDAEGRPVSRYALKSAWPSRIEINGLKAGSSEVLVETVTLVCENVERVNP